MQISGSIHQFSKELKLLISVFLLTLSIGFYGGITFVNDTTSSSPKGIEQRYLGNEEDENATKMMFKKSSGEIKTLVHNHILSLSVIFFIVSLILLTTSIDSKVKLFLIIEPFISILCTFGGIYLMWLTEISWIKYIIMISGILMTLTYTITVFTIFRQLYFKKVI